jgi:hypothetical protein
VAVEFLLGIALLLIFLLLITIHTARASAVNHYVIERKRREYLHALEIVRHAPQNQAYQRLAYTLGQSYIAVEDPTIFDESLLAQDLARHNITGHYHGHRKPYPALDTAQQLRDIINE